MRKTKKWRNVIVDAGLHCDWLVQMNALSLWSVHSTCEGHPLPIEAGEHSNSHMSLILKHKFYLTLGKTWDQNRSALEKLFYKCFTHFQTNWDVCHQRNGNTDHIRNFDPPEASKEETEIADNVEKFLNDHSTTNDCIGLHLDHTEQRQSEEMPESVARWWEETIRSLKELDEKMAELTGSALNNQERD